jgi:DNA polymerase IV (DinB-like DNA polymerase)
MRVIMLVDMDYFYVACEELRHPEIKGRPAVVGMDPKGRSGSGVVLTCNYKAREFGIHSGMPISMAYKIKPDAIYLPLDYDYYDVISKRVMEAIKPLASKFEQVSIDEAFVDVSDRVLDCAEAERYARRIRDEVFEKARIGCSVGIGPNKLIAKMACEKAKPNGIKLVKEAEVGEFLKGMDVDELYGIGGKTSEKLKKLGYGTVEKLAKANMMRMVEQFGSFGTDMIRSANGVDDGEVNESYDVKSIGRELTFEENTNDEKEVGAAIEKLGKEVIKDLDKNQKSFKTITLKLRYGDFTEHIHSRSIRATCDFDMLIATSKELYRKNADRGRKIRKIGVRISNFVDYKGQKKIMRSA